ncbi:MAG: hypothetical protein M5T52_23370 [Ignavibacteriaceae bacterium]|nr:hypothetical protein [Ignavibacteriaceae bacterium]
MNKRLLIELRFLEYIITINPIAARRVEVRKIVWVKSRSKIEWVSIIVKLLNCLIAVIIIKNLKYFKLLKTFSYRISVYHFFSHFD